MHYGVCLSLLVCACIDSCDVLESSAKDAHCCDAMLYNS